MRHGVAQHGCGGSAAQLHTRSVDDVACFQLSATGDSGVTNRNASDGVAFVLDFFSAFAADCSRNTSAKLKVIIRGIDDGVRIHLGQIALVDRDFFCKNFVHVLVHEVVPVFFPLREFLEAQNSISAALGHDPGFAHHGDFLPHAATHFAAERDSLKGSLAASHQFETF